MAEEFKVAGYIPVSRVAVGYSDYSQLDDFVIEAGSIVAITVRDEPLYFWKDDECSPS
jgi:hypothetical protein